MRRRLAIRPFAARGRVAIVAILAVFVLLSTASVTLSVKATERSRNHTAIVQVAGRQPVLAGRYVQAVLLAREGRKAEAAALASVMTQSAQVLRDGGTAPAVSGEDEARHVPTATGSEFRAQLTKAQKLVRDLTATGNAILVGRPVSQVLLTAGESITITDPAARLRALGALTANAALNATRTIAVRSDDNISYLVMRQVTLGIAGVLASLLLAWAIVYATRRQTAYFRSFVTSSTDLVLVFGVGGCRYVSESVIAMVGRPEADLLGPGFMEFVHDDDRDAVTAAIAGGGVHEIDFLFSNKFGEWRHLDAHVNDLRNDRQIRGVVFNARDITERIRLEAELSHQAFHDGLTSLANRMLFHDRLEQTLVRSDRSREPLAVLLIDLDRFKQINDTLGHSSGDRLLQYIAARFADITRASDTLARLGGDEFAVLLDGVSEAESIAIAQRYIEQLYEPVFVSGRELVLNASIGIAPHPGGGGSGEELLRCADVAMYAAKRTIGGHYEVFRPDMSHEVGDLLGLENELRQALQRTELNVHYQPEIDLITKAIVGVEALVRWSSPTRGVVTPDQFIPVAEATDLIVPLGEFVLHEACKRAAEWRALGLLSEQFVMWVNLSGTQLSKGVVGALVREALEAYDLPARYLGLEVTETALAVEARPDDAARTELESLHALGVHIAIDDFGTGFSSLDQLRRFPIDVIKVDRSFVQGVEHDPKSAAITANVVSLAHALGLVAVAEGIETTGQLDSALELGCDLAQGNLFTRASPADEIADLLARHRTEASSIGPDDFVASTA